MVNKKKAFNSVAIEQFVENRTSNAPLEETGRATNDRILALRDCGNHYALLTGQGMNKDERPLGCHICKGSIGRGSKQQASSHVEAANATIKRVFPKAKIITEARVLAKFNGGLDFTIEWVDTKGKARVIDVEVDGESHFQKSIHGSHPELQGLIDKEKDDLVLRHGRRMLRLHFNDKSRWVDNLLFAKKQAEENERQIWILYSLSYGRKKDRYRKIKKLLTLKR